MTPNAKAALSALFDAIILTTFVTVGVISIEENLWLGVLCLFTGFLFAGLSRTDSTK